MPIRLTIEYPENRRNDLDDFSNYMRNTPDFATNSPFQSHYSVM